jgi:hypothetical protein
MHTHAYVYGYVYVCACVCIHVCLYDYALVCVHMNALHAFMPLYNALHLYICIHMYIYIIMIQIITYARYALTCKQPSKKYAKLICMCGYICVCVCVCMCMIMIQIITRSRLLSQTAAFQKGHKTSYVYVRVHTAIKHLTVYTYTYIYIYTHTHTHKTSYVCVCEHTAITHLTHTRYALTCKQPSKKDTKALSLHRIAEATSLLPGRRFFPREFGTMRGAPLESKNIFLRDACIHVCVCVCMYALYMYVCMYICMYVYMYYACMYMCMYSKYNKKKSSYRRL